MTNHAGIIRSAESLQSGLEQIVRLEKQLPDDKTEYHTLLSHNLLTVAKLIIRSALYRQESRGGHYREDFPDNNDTFLYHIVQQKGREIHTTPVNKNCESE